MVNGESIQLNSNGQSVVLLRCESCSSKIVVQRPAGEIVVLGRALIFKGQGAVSVCPQCKNDVLIEGLRFEPKLVIVENGTILKTQEKNLLTSSSNSVITVP